MSNLNLGENEEKSQVSNSSGNQDQTQNNLKSKNDDKKNTTKQKTKSIQRCPKCRSINPPDAKYCQQCGKVFREPES